MAYIFISSAAGLGSNNQTNKQTNKQRIFQIKIISQSLCILWLWVKQWRNRSNWWLRPREILIRASTHKTNAASLHTTYHTMHTEQHTPLHTTLIIKHFTAHLITLYSAQISKHTCTLQIAHFTLNSAHFPFWTCYIHFESMVGCRHT